MSFQCSECGATCNDGSEKCSACGFPFVRHGVLIPCPSCQSKISKFAEACPKCGINLLLNAGGPSKGRNRRTAPGDYFRRNKLNESISPFKSIVRIAITVIVVVISSVVLYNSWDWWSKQVAHRNAERAEAEIKEKGFRAFQDSIAQHNENQTKAKDLHELLVKYQNAPEITYVVVKRQFGVDSDSGLGQYECASLMDHLSYLLITMTFRLASFRRR